MDECKTLPHFLRSLMVEISSTSAASQGLTLVHFPARPEHGLSGMFGAFSGFQ